MSFQPDSPPPDAPLPARRPQLKALLIPLAAAAVMILALMIFIQIPADEAPKSSSSEPLPAPQTPSPPKPPAAPVAPAFPELLPRPVAHSADEISLALPMQAGTASLAWITRSIRENRVRPPADVVRLEEILNQFPLRPAGPTAVSRGITLSTEAISCPWKPSATLLLISFRGASDAPRKINATFKPDPTNIKRYRLLGYASADDAAFTPTPILSRLPAKSIHSLVIEIETSTATTALGHIEWAVNDQACSPLVLSRQTAAEPSDDARFAALVCIYAQWLADERPVLINADILAALAREVASQTLPAARLDFLNLIDQSLRL